MFQFFVFVVLILSVAFAEILTEEYQDGGKYVGEMHNDPPHGLLRFGKGTMNYATGDKFEGEWKWDMINGFGKITYKSGNIYEGQWEDNMHHGIGTKIWAAGASYTGEWVLDKIQGKGTYTYQNGNQYIGDWWSNVRHGHGVLKNKAGQIIEQGVWVEDVKRNE